MRENTTRLPTWGRPQRISFVPQTCTVANERSRSLRVSNPQGKSELRSLTCQGSQFYFISEVYGFITFILSPGDIYNGFKKNICNPAFQLFQVEGSHPEYLVCYTTGYLARPKAAGNFKHQLTCHFCPTLHAKLNATSPFPSCTTSGKHSAQSTSPCTTLLWVPVTPLSLLSLCSFLVSFLTPPLPTPKCCHPSLEGSVLSSLQTLHIQSRQLDSLLQLQIPSIIPGCPSAQLQPNLPCEFQIIPTDRLHLMFHRLFQPNVLLPRPKVSTLTWLRQNHVILIENPSRGYSTLLCQSSAHNPPVTSHLTRMKIQRSWMTWSP